MKNTCFSILNINLVIQVTIILVKAAVHKHCAYVDFVHSLEEKKEPSPWEDWYLVSSSPFLDYVKGLKVYFLELSKMAEDHKIPKGSV